MNIKFEYSITVDEFLEMIKSVGWKKYTKEQVDENITNILAEIDTVTSEDVDNIISGIFPEPR